MGSERGRLQTVLGEGCVHEALVSQLPDPLKVLLSQNPGILQGQGIIRLGCSCQALAQR